MVFKQSGHFLSAVCGKLSKWLCVSLGKDWEVCYSTVEALKVPVSGKPGASSISELIEPGFKTETWQDLGD